MPKKEEKNQKKGAGTGEGMQREGRRGKPKMSIKKSKKRHGASAK